MADQKIKFNLAISLHSAIQSVREFLMPFSNKILIEDLIDSLRYWINIKKSIITFEYIVFDGINDSETDIIELIKICKKIPSKVNLIQYNSINDDNFRNASIKSINRYSKLLSENNIINTIRKSRGDDIDAACGQLANNSLNLKKIKY
jgi:23S rRNA (adenine2503-C2)-methyltransferase